MAKLVPKKTRPILTKKKSASRRRTKPKPTLWARLKARVRRLLTRIFGKIWQVLRWPILIFWRIFWRASAVGLAIAVSSTGYYYSTLPELSQLIDGRARGSVIILDRNNEVFAWRGDHFAEPATASSISFYLKNAIIATEDKRFYRHFGISPRGVGSAVIINLREGRGPFSGHGGSTITQQSAKLLCIGRAYDPTLGQSEAEFEAACRQSSLWRKLKEASYALAMELAYTKDEILTLYLNRVFLGAGARGVEAASQRYFDKRAAYLSPSEAAMIAGLLVAPSYYAPTNNLRRARERAALVLRLMYEQGYLSASQRQVAAANPAKLSRAAEIAIGGDFADWIMRQTPRFLGHETTEDVSIRTSFDPAIQRAANAALADIFKTKVKASSKAQAAIVVLSRDGAVRALIGGRKTTHSGGFNRAVQARRQPGSAFKPFVYAAALEAGHSPLSIVSDSPITLKIPGSGTWSPRNYDRKFRGDVTLTEALYDSLNVPTVIVSENVGREKIITLARAFGFGPKLLNTPALALGTSETTLLELTSAYASIANGGFRTKPWGIRDIRLKGNKRPIFNGINALGDQVITLESARQLTFMLTQVIGKGTGKRAALERHPAAGKTGTTQATRDAWFIGFTAHYIAGVWMGYDNNAPLSGVTGGGLPADIWRETMERIHADLPVKAFPQALPRTAPTRIGTPTTQTAHPPKKSGFIGGVLESLFGG